MAGVNRREMLWPRNKWHNRAAGGLKWRRMLWRRIGLTSMHARNNGARRRRRGGNVAQMACYRVKYGSISKHNGIDRHNCAAHRHRFM